MRTKIPRPIGELLDQVIGGLGIKASLDEARVVDAWAEVAGPNIMSVTDSVWMRRGKLYVKITSSTWRQELHMQRQGWCDRINGQVGAEVVKEVVFR